jgi:hypothetical protein
MLGIGQDLERAGEVNLDQSNGTRQPTRWVRGRRGMGTYSVEALVKGKENLDWLVAGVCNCTHLE